MHYITTVAIATSEMWNPHDSKKHGLSSLGSSQSYWVHKIQSGNEAENKREMCSGKGYVHTVVFKEGTNNSICVSTHRVHHQVLAWLNSKHSCVHVLGAHHKHPVTEQNRKQHGLPFTPPWSSTENQWITIPTATEQNRKHSIDYHSHRHATVQKTSVDYHSHCHRTEQKTAWNTIHTTMEKYRKHPWITIHTVTEQTKKKY